MLRRLAGSLFALTLAGLALGGCTVHEVQHTLAVAPSDIPNAWGPIKQCAAQKGRATRDRKSGGVDVQIDNLLAIYFHPRDNQMAMDVVIWAEVSPEDKKKIVERMEREGFEIWECAKKIGFQPAAP